MLRRVDTHLFPRNTTRLRIQKCNHRAVTKTASIAGSRRSKRRYLNREVQK
jgi:hypothetical protein